MTGSLPSEDSSGTVADAVFAQVRRLLPSGLDAGITLDSSLYEIGLDSLARMEALNGLEETFGVRFSEESLSDMETCRDLVEYIEANAVRGGLKLFSPSEARSARRAAVGRSARRAAVGRSARRAAVGRSARRAAVGRSARRAAVGRSSGPAAVGRKFRPSGRRPQFRPSGRRPQCSGLGATVGLSDSADSTEDLPVQQGDVTQFPECIAFRQRLADTAAAGLENPFFRSKDQVVGAAATIAGREVISYTSFDYLGLGGHPQVVAAAKKAIDRLGASASASRLVGGNHTIVQQLDAELARFLGVEAAVVSPSGYGTNASVFGHLFAAEDLILYDELAHNSIVQGTLLSKAQRRPLPHNDYRFLDSLLADIRGRIIAASWSHWKASTAWTATTPTCRDSSMSNGVTRRCSMSTRRTRSA